jgi:feruloyl-CoA synthase
VWLNVADQEPVRAALAAKLANFNRARQGGASTVARLLVLTDPPSAEAGEVTDKRSINQQRVLERRAADVDALYAATLDPRVVLPIQGIQHG